jgi:hypothetical protein
MYPLLSSARNNRRLIAEAADAAGAAVPTGRAVVERPAVAEGAAMSARAAALRNLDDHRTIGRIDCGQRHGLRASCEKREARGKTIETSHLWISKPAPLPEAIAQPGQHECLPNRRRTMDGLHRNVNDRAQCGHQHEQDLIRLTPHCQIPAALLSSTRAIPAANAEDRHEHL